MAATLRDQAIFGKVFVAAGVIVPTGTPLPGASPLPKIATIAGGAFLRQVLIVREKR